MLPAATQGRHACWWSVRTGRYVPAGQHSWAVGDVPLSKSVICNVPVLQRTCMCNAQETWLGSTTQPQCKSHDGLCFSLHFRIFLQQACIPYAVITVTLEKQSKRRGNTPQVACKHAACCQLLLTTVILGGSRVAQGRPGHEATPALTLATPRQSHSGAFHWDEP